MNNFWQKQKSNFLAMAPMAGITDSAFRQMCKKYGCDVTYSEMASATALFYDAKKKKNLDKSETLKLLKFSEIERPYVVQLFGSDPEHFAKAAKIISEKIKPDGIDINFGCPVKKIQKQGAGAVLMKDMKLARKVIEATINNTDLPVSIKTRTKVEDISVLDFLDYIKELDIKALMIHGRTLKQMFQGDVDTAVIKKARDHFGGVVMANGGINSWEEANKILKLTRADGLGIARGAMGRPWIFREVMCSTSTSCMKQGKLDKKGIFKVVLEHVVLAEKLKGRQGIIEMRKHLCWYLQGLPGARKMRRELVQVETIDDVRRIFKEFQVC